MDKAITDFLRLGIEPDGLNAGSELLLKFEGGTLAVDVSRARGHCQVIDNIFGKYLDKWFDRVLAGDELASMRTVFAQLGSADFSVFDTLENVASQLQKNATDVLNGVYAGQIDAARSQILDARKELQPLKIAMSEALRVLFGLKSEFLRIGEIA